jgi:hypothetical protein
VNAYPSAYTAEWWLKRREIENAIAVQSRKRGSRYSEAQYRRSELARLTALGDEAAERAYQRGEW